jgi:hypothetical protein
MDEVRAGEDVTVEVQAFADDQLVLISASSLAKLEAAWDKKWAACQLWASAHKLKYAPEKTTAIFVPAKSGLVRFGQNGKTLVRKNPRLRMGNGNIRIEKAVKYLGVVIDRGLLWMEHARYVANKLDRVATCAERRDYCIAVPQLVLHAVPHGFSVFSFEFFFFLTNHFIFIDLIN